MCGKVQRCAGNTSTTCINCEAAGLKYCVHCKTVKPLNEFEQRRGKVGSICKQCKNAKQNMRYKTDTIFKTAMNISARQYSNDRYATDKRFRAAEQVRKQHRRALGELTVEQWQAICTRYGNVCAYCGASADLTLDHIVPVSKDGKTTLANIVPACTACNSSKQARDLLDWYPLQDFFSEYRLDMILKQQVGGVDY